MKYFIAIFSIKIVVLYVSVIYVMWSSYRWKKTDQWRKILYEYDKSLNKVITKKNEEIIYLNKIQEQIN